MGRRTRPGAQRVRDIDRGWKDLVKGLHRLARAPLVTVGIHEDRGGQRSDEDDAGSPTVAEYATFNEFGLGVPERSFLRSTVERQKDVYGEAIAAGAVEELRGGQPMETTLALVGEQAASDVRQTITDGVDPPNSPLTVAIKGSSKTLVDTGRMRQSVDYEVHPGRKR